MQMQKVYSGKLRAIGYDAAQRQLVVEFDNGQSFAYANVGESIWRNLQSSGNVWSYFRDNIEEDYTAQPFKKKQSDKPDKNPLDDLFNS